MTGTTARYALTTLNPTGSDPINVVNDFNNNWNAIDLLLGSQVCTSTTRPSSPVQGQLIYETDTTLTRVYKGSAWKNVGNATSLSSARPANPIQGDELFETDTGVSRSYGSSAWLGFLSVATSSSLPANPIEGDSCYLSDIKSVAYYTGSAWYITNMVVCTSSTRPTGSALQTGTAIFETDTSRILNWNGSTWIEKAYCSFPCTSSTHPSAPFNGLEILETDTGLSATYNGSGYLYNAQQIAPTQILGATTASVTFSSVPAVNRLLLAWRTRTSASGGVFVQMQVDGNTGSNYLWNKSSASAGASLDAHSGALVAQINIGITDGNTTSYFGGGFTVIEGWGSSTGFLSCSGDYANWSSTTADDIGNAGGLFAVVGPHTSLKIFPSTNSFVAGSEFSLYALP